MLRILEDIFATMKIENSKGESIDLHSNTPVEQGKFLQKLFDQAKPSRSLEIGLAYGISALFILEKHREYNNESKAHIIIEPYPWDGIAEHNIKQAGLLEFADIRYKKSDEVLPSLYMEKYKIQFAYIDTTKLFDIVMQDIYFIDKILEVNGVVILDDCGGYWPGIQKVARFLNTLPHYQFLEGYGSNTMRLRRRIAEKITSFFLKLVPFRNKFMRGFNLKTDYKLNLEYRCIAFRKIGEDKRNWDWDMPF